MAGPRPLQLGFELVAHNAVEGFIRHLYAKLLAQPALHIEITGKAWGRRQARLALREHRWRQGLLARWRPRLFGGQES
jgi:hypothetical protein